MLRINRALATVITVAALLTTPACYTLFKHPRLAELNYARPQERDCSVCHSAQELWAFTHPKSHHEKHGAWKDYYDYPWWFDEYWRLQRDSEHRDKNEEDDE